MKGLTVTPFPMVDITDPYDLLKFPRSRRR
jgi:hypothetical protein